MIDKNDKLDITIVGAGVIGCAVAYELGRCGAAVRVLESRDVGLGATQASAGVLAPYIEAHHPGPLRALGLRSLDMYDAFVADVVADSGKVVPYERTGTLEVATDDASLTRLEQTRQGLASAGVACRMLSQTEARVAEPHLGESVRGALLLPSQGFVGAAALTAALRRAGARHGVSFLTSHAASRLSVADGEIEIETAQGTVTSDAVVLAAGSWTGRVAVAGGAPLPVRPVRGQLLRLLWPGTRLARVIWSSLCYVVPWHDGSVLVGATVEEVGFDEGATVAGVTSLLDGVGNLLPATRDAGFDEVRVGLRPGTPDDLPIVGWSSAVPHLVYATGHYRNGVLLAPLTARLVADLVLDGRIDPLLEAVAPGRFDAS
ncbi:MAG: glycine oxidase ThiO [Vicinamibacterales bacterium]|nr:glycine oxidase ThiO [Vicinamibacterales bacterium]MDP7691741.1 glycine oxidase ThiO [Vicinamibacterales bacterium]HJN42745.1 glycine oxidase ThiO [Vicinamibacterales bacterium]